MDTQPQLTGPAPGFIKAPDYVVDMEPAGDTLRIEIGGKTLANSTNALVMYETNHLPVYYIPRSEVDMNILERTDYSSY